MANNFKIGAEYVNPIYISKSGHDSNDGLNPDTPKRSIQYSSGRQVVGAGVYIAPKSTASIGSDWNNLTGDGKVIIDAENALISTRTLWNSENIEIRNVGGVSGGSQGAGENKDILIRNCNLDYDIVGRSKGFNTSIVINSTLRLGDDSTLAFSRGIVQASLVGINNSTNSGIIRLSNSYVSKDSTILNISTDSTQRNNNFRGTLEFSPIAFSDRTTKKYAFKGELQGTPQDNGYEIGVKWYNAAQLIADGYLPSTSRVDESIATWINKPPLFNNESLEDFSLQAGSPHIGAADDGSNIGGTFPAISIYNTSNGTSQIITSPEINTTNPESFTLKQGFTEGYIDYIEKVGSTNLVLKEISPIAQLEFNSDIEGGNIGNQNVPDSEPLSIEYPRKLITTSDALDATTLNVAGHDAVVGEFVRVAGEDREVISITADTITLDTAFRAIVTSGTEFQVGEKARIGALNPNRLTFMMRTSKEDNPQVDSDWDNDINPIYNKAGDFLTQEWGQVPSYYIDTINNEVGGSGDSETPTGLDKNEISCKWVHIRVYLRNNYES